MKKMLLFVLLTAMLLISGALLAQDDADPNPDDGWTGEFIPLVESTGGPDGYGYVWATSGEPTCNYQWVNLTNMTPLSGLNGVYNGEVEIFLTEPFVFYGVEYDTLHMSSEGFLTTEFSNTSWDRTPDCPLPTAPDFGSGARLYALHTSLDMSDPDAVSPGNGRVQYYMNCPRDSNSGQDESCTIFLWDNVVFDGSTTGNDFDIQAILYHDSGEIVYQYNNGSDGDGIPNQLDDLGGLGLIRQTYGIQSADLNYGIAAACGGTFEQVINAGDALCFRREAITPDRVPLGQQRQVPDSLFWREIPGEEWYNVNVTGMGTTYDMWFTADDVCLFVIDWCSIPMPVYTPGSYNWTISYWQASRGTIVTGTTTQFSFSGAPPAALNRIYPADGSTLNAPPSVVWWQPDANALWYNVQVIDSNNTVVLNDWHHAGDICNFPLLSGGPGGLGYCRAGWVVPPTSGTYTLRLQGWGPSGFGASSDTTFTIGTYTAPTNTIAVRQPANNAIESAQPNTLLAWSHDQQATWYHIIISGPGLNIDAWYHAADICLIQERACYYYNNAPLNVGEYTWTIETWNPQGFGPSGDTTTFTLTP